MPEAIAAWIQTFRPLEDVSSKHFPWLKVIKTTKTLANLELRLALGIALAIRYVSSLYLVVVKVKTQEETPEEIVHV